MIVLVGFMGAGKTTVGRILAGRLGLPFVDSDLAIEQRLGRPVRQVFETDGEAFFREVEHATIRDLLQGPDAVVALGGGALGDARTRAALGDATVVYLEVSFAGAVERVGGDRGRPMLHRPGLEELHAERVAAYRDAASITVDTGGRTPPAVADELLRLLTAD